MFDIERKNGKVYRCFAKCGGFHFACYGEGDAAEKEASDLVYSYYKYNNILSRSNKLLESYKCCGFNQEGRVYANIDQEGKYLAHWLAHRVYLMRKKLDEIDDEFEGKFASIFQNLGYRYKEQLSANNVKVEDLIYDLNNVTESFSKILSAKFSVCLTKCSDITCIAKSSSSLEVFEENISRELSHPMRAFNCEVSGMHLSLHTLAEVLAKACKIESVQQDPSLGTRICKLYKKMECFLDNYCRIEKEEYDRILEVAEKAEAQEKAGSLVNEAEAQEKAGSLVNEAKNILDMLGSLDLSKVKQEDCQALLTSCARFVESQRKKDEQAGKQLERADSSESLDMEMDHDSLSTKI